MFMIREKVETRLLVDGGSISGYFRLMQWGQQQPEGQPDSTASFCRSVAQRNADACSAWRQHAPTDQIPLEPRVDIRQRVSVVRYDRCR